MTTPKAAELRTKVLVYQHTQVASAGGDVEAVRSLYRTAWGKLTASPMSEGFAGGIDTTQTYDLWLRYDSSYQTLKPMSIYANGYWFNINSIEVVWQQRFRWEKLRLTIDRYEEIGTTTTTTDIVNTTTPA
jgi:hypothetical protein